jgi:hypothetical protein
MRIALIIIIGSFSSWVMGCFSANIKKKSQYANNLPGGFSFFYDLF